MPNRTVYIPDELEQEAKPLIEKKQINLSAVCQEALQREVIRLRPIRVDEDFEPIIERLRADKGDYQEKWRTRGQVLALQWARKISYDRLVWWLKARERGEKRDPIDFIVGGPEDHPEFESWAWDAVNKYPVLKDFIGPDEEGHVYVARCADDSFIDGFATGMDAFWDRVKEGL